MQTFLIILTITLCSIIGVLLKLIKKLINREHLSLDIQQYITRTKINSNNVI